MSTAFVNSATHLWGDAPFDDGMISSCVSRTTFLFIPMLGENWHNNHHAVPASASTWSRYQVDFVYLTLRLLEGVGLVRDIRVEVPEQPPGSARPPPTRFPSWCGGCGS